MHSSLGLPLSVACFAAAWIPTVQSTGQPWAHKNTEMQNVVVDLGMDKFAATGRECKLQDFSNEPAFSFSKIQGNETYVAAALSFLVDTPAHSGSFKPEKLLEGSSAYLSYLQPSMHNNGSTKTLSSEKEALVPFKLPEAPCGKNIVFIAFVSAQPPTLRVDDSYNKLFAEMKKDASKRKDCKFKEFWKSAALGEIKAATWINIGANDKAKCPNGGGKTKTTTIVTNIKGAPTAITTTVPAETPAGPKNGTHHGAGTTEKKEAVTTITTTVDGKPTTITTKVPTPGHTKEAQGPGPAKGGYDVVTSTITTTKDGKPIVITTTVTTPSSAPQKPGDFFSGGGAKTNGTVTPGKDSKGEKEKQQKGDCTTAAATAITSTITTTSVSGTKTLTSTTVTTITNPASAGAGKGEGVVTALPYPAKNSTQTQKTTTTSSESFITSEKVTTTTTTDAKGSPATTVLTTTVTATVLSLLAPGETVLPVAGGPDEGYDGQQTSKSPILPTGALSSLLVPFNNSTATTTTKASGSGNGVVITDPTGIPSAGGPSAGVPSAGAPSAGPGLPPPPAAQAGAPAMKAGPAVMAALVLGGLGSVFFAFL